MPESLSFSITLEGDNSHFLCRFGSFVVKLLSERRPYGADAVCIERQLLLTNKLQPQQPPRHVKQFQILDWPLHLKKPPKTGLAILQLMVRA